MDSSIIDLSHYRFQRALEDLETARENLNAGRYKASVNRSYYAIFHGMRAVVVLKEFDSSKHSGIIGFFNRNFVKEEIFDRGISKIVDGAFRLREKADYDDFYVVSRQQASDQFEKAEEFLKTISQYLEAEWNS